MATVTATYIFNRRAMAQAVSRQPLTAESRVRSRVNPCGIYGGQSGTGTGFSLSSAVFPCPYHSIIVLHTHIYNLRPNNSPRWWPQFRDIVSAHQHEYLQQYSTEISYLFRIHRTTEKPTSHEFHSFLMPLSDNTVSPRITRIRVTRLRYFHL
jgi:hypothetical protein